jgi:putative peptide zinc metalloprotease protein
MLDTAVREGETVAAGSVLVRLLNLEIDRQAEKLAGQAATQRLRVDNLFRRQQSNDAEATAELPTAREALADLEARLNQRRADQARLTLHAPAAGTVLAPPRRIEQPAEGELATWTGTPLDARNRGSLLERGTLVCQIGDPRRLEAVLVIDQADVDFVRVGQRVRLRLNQLSRQFLAGEIVEIAELDMDLVPRELLAEKELAARTDQAGQVRPLSTTYQARVRLDAQWPRSRWNGKRSPGYSTATCGGRYGWSYEARSHVGAPPRPWDPCSERATPLRLARRTYSSPLRFRSTHSATSTVSSSRTSGGQFQSGKGSSRSTTTCSPSGRSSRS